MDVRVSRKSAHCESATDCIAQTCGQRIIEESSEKKQSPAHCIDEAEVEIVMYLEYVGGKSSISKVREDVRWKERFEENCGDLLSFLQSHSIFALSGDADVVTVLRNSIRKAAISKKSDNPCVIAPQVSAPQNTFGPSALPRKGVRPFNLRDKIRQKDAPIKDVGKIAISCISQGIDLNALQRRFRQWNYVSTISNKVLHVTDKRSKFRQQPKSDLNTSEYGQNYHEIEEMYEDTISSSDPEHFDLFVFSYGSVVWWGYNMNIYKTIEKEFIPFSTTSRGTEEDSLDGSIFRDPYSQKYVQELFPIWCTFETMSQCDKSASSSLNSLSEESLERLYSQDFPFTLPYYSNSVFLEALQRDHIILPIELPAVKQAISHALAQNVKLDIIEPGVRDLLQICKPFPVQIKEHGRTNIKHSQVNQLKGQLFLLRMELKSDSELFEEPEFFWDFPWFKQIFRIIRDDYGVESRICLLDEKLSAVQLTLDMIGNQFNEEHGRRLEWIIIILIMIEVIIAVAELMLEMGYSVHL